MFYLPVIGAVAYSLTTLFEKAALKKNKINPNHFVIAIFLASVVLMIPLLFVLGGIKEGALQPKNLLILGGIVIVSIFANIAYFYAIKWEKISNLEPVLLLEPIFTMLLAFIIFSSERNPKIIIPAVIAGLALLFSHIKKHHLNFNKYVLAAILGSILFALDSVLSKIILNYYTPLTLYFLRNLFILVALFIFIRPNLKKELNKKSKIYALIIGALWVIYRVIAYYGFMKLGLVFTTLILMLTPIFIYLFAWKFLKEKLEWRNIVASIIIVASIGYVLLS